MRAWRGTIVLARVLIDQLGRELGTQSGLSMADYEVLVQLSEAPDRRLRMTDLASFALSSKSRLSHHIARLVEVGWVRREACPSDRRGAFAVLTDAGFAVLAGAAPGHVESVRRHLFDQLTAEETAQLAAITAKVGRHLDGLAESPLPAALRQGC